MAGGAVSDLGEALEAAAEGREAWVAAREAAVVRGAWAVAPGNKTLGVAAEKQVFPLREHCITSSFLSSSGLLYESALACSWQGEASASPLVLAARQAASPHGRQQTGTGSGHRLYE